MADAILNRTLAVAGFQGPSGWRTQERLLTAGLLALDCLALTAAFVLALLLRFGNPMLPYFGQFSWPFYTRVTVLCVPLYVVIFALHHLYDTHTLFGGTREYGRIAAACTFGIVGVIVFGFMERDKAGSISRGWLLAAWALSLALVGVARFGCRRLVYRLRWKGHLLARTLILGTNEEARAVAEQLRANPAGGLQLVGFVGERLEPGTPMLDGLRVLGGDADLPWIIGELDVHEVVIAPTAISRERLLDLHHMLSDLPGVHLRLTSGLYEILTTGVQVHDVGNVPLISFNRLRITGVEALLKACLDYGLAIPGLVLISPVLLLLAILIKRSSPGPIIHRRRVLGMGGKVFDAYKFRSMVTNADQVLAEMLEKDPALKREYESERKLKNDPRVTPIGRVLRKYSLDELPQVLNVLKGEMSLVGPRMIAPEEATCYGKWSTNLLTVKPGITGPWQVMGRNELSYNERVRLSMHYIRNYSIWTDLRIIFQTIKVVTQGKGSY